MSSVTPLGKYIGLCAASHSLICGTELALNAVRKNSGKVYLMLLASDASERTVKQIKDKCSFYGIKLLCLTITMDQLAWMAGKSSSVAAAAVTNSGLAEQIMKITEAAE